MVDPEKLLKKKYDNYLADCPICGAKGAFKSGGTYTKPGREHGRSQDVKWIMGSCNECHSRVHEMLENFEKRQKTVKDKDPWTKV